MKELEGSLHEQELLKRCFRDNAGYSRLKGVHYFRGCLHEMETQKQNLRGDDDAHRSTGTPSWMRATVESY
jgi:hypothetical protein